MKKVLSVVLAFILIFGICAVSASAAVAYDLSFKSGDKVDFSLYSSRIYSNRYNLKLEFNADTNEPIYGGIYRSGDREWYRGFGVSTYESYKVQAKVLEFGGTGPILVKNDHAFSSNVITELNIPFNVYAFDYANEGYETALTESQRTGEPLKSGEGVFMFANCSRLTTVTIDNPSDVLFNWGFYNCRNLTNVVFTDKVTTICRGMFENCIFLSGIEIPPSVSKICDCAFYNTELKSIKIPSTVKTIEPYALGYQGNVVWSSEYPGVDCGDCADYINNYPDDYNITKVTGFKIYGESGSEAERYANENGFEFIEAEDKVNSASVYNQAALGEYAEINVVASTGADKIQFVSSKGDTVTYTRDSNNVKILKYNSTIMIETWIVKLKVYKLTETYYVKAKYGKIWTSDKSVKFILNALNLYYENKVCSAQVDIPALTGKYAKVNVTAGGSPSKIQFRDSAGNTFTYTRDNANVTKIEADSTSQTEIWTVKQKVYKPTEYYTVAAKYKTGWSGGTVSVTIKELVKSSADITFKIVNHSDDYDYDDRLYITVPAGTKRIVAGNAFEGNTGSGEYTREWVEANDHSGDLYDPGIGNIGNGQEQWDLPNGAIFWLINLGGELSYLSVELADGSWTVGGYYGWEEHNNYRYVPCLRMAETEPVTEPVEEPVKTINFAQAVSQSEIGGYVYVFVSAGKGASKIQFANNSGSTITYTRSSSAVNSISQSGDNEIWAISLKVYRPSDTYTVKAKYGREWITGSGITFTVTAQ